MSGIKCQKERDGKAERGCLGKRRNHPTLRGADGAYTHTSTTKTRVHVQNKVIL